MIATVNPPARSKLLRSGFSAMEFMVIAVVFGIGVVTLYGMFQKSSEDAFQSKWTYLAANAARSELEAIRTLNLFQRNGVDGYVGHDWRALAGSMLTDIEQGDIGGRPEFQYPDSYQRIETKVELRGPAGEDPPDPADRMVLVTVYVRYQEKGPDSYGLQDKAGNIKAIGTFRTLIVNRERR